MARILQNSAVILAVLLPLATGLGLFKHGRPKHGMLGAPLVKEKYNLPPDMWFKQKLDHFNDADLRTWNQVRATSGRLWKECPELRRRKVPPFRYRLSARWWAWACAFFCCAFWFI